MGAAGSAQKSVNLWESTWSHVEYAGKPVLLLVERKRLED